MGETTGQQGTGQEEEENQAASYHEAHVYLPKI
jgi:hypothetical protein